MHKKLSRKQSEQQGTRSVLLTARAMNKLSAKELQLLGARVSFSGSASNLGVTIDSQLTVPDHVTFALSVMFLPSTPAGQIIADYRDNTDACACVHQQPSRLL